MLTSFFDTWTSIFSNHAVLRTAIGFIHVGGLMAAGGCAITADLATIEAVREGPIGRSSQMHVLKRTHEIVVAGLAALIISGLLLFAADADTFIHSPVFWLKMALMVTLIFNGAIMMRGERKAMRGDTRAWAELHHIAVFSLVLWFVTTLVGAALPKRVTTMDDKDICRREFLQTAGCFGMTMALMGLGAADALALPVGEAVGTENGNEKSYPIPSADSVKIDHGAGLIVARYQGHVYVFALACPHENYAVKWVAKDHRFQCTKHDSKYEPAGIHTEGRATRNMDRYLIRRDGDNVVVDLHKWIQSDKDPKGWEAASIAV